MRNWFKKLFRKKEKKNTQLFKEVREGNNVKLYDQQTVDYLESELQDSTQDKFLKLIAKSEKIIISKKEANKDKIVKTPIIANGKTIEIEGHPVESIKFIEITETQELQVIQKHFEILNESKGHLMCVGNLLFEFIDKKGNSVEVEYLGFGHIRMKKVFKNDAELKRPMEFLNWLDSIGISEPLNDWIEADNRRKENEKRLLEWKSVAPKTLVKSLESVNQNSFGEIDENLFNELKSEIPDEKELVLRLFKLYGTGFHNWNSVPVYEMIPGNILLGVSIDFLNNLFEIEDLDKEQKEGIARFLSSWDFSQKRKSDIDKVSQKVKDELIIHLEGMGNEDKISEFKKTVEK